MIKNLFKFLVFCYSVFLLCLSVPVLAQKQTIVINEIAWMGTKTSYNDEWIELYNPTPSSVVLNNWTLRSKEGKPEIELSGTIGAKSYFLLERTDDSTVPEIDADQIYTGGLNNGGEHLFLLDDAGGIADEVDCTLGWFAGNNETKRTMERINPLLSGSTPNNWKTSQKSGGTPRAQNSPIERIEKEKELKITPASTEGSDFSLVFAPSLSASLFLSILILTLWLKIKRKKDKITKKKSTF